MGGATASYLDGDRDGRLHLQHGPIDLVIGVDGDVDRGASPSPTSANRAHAYTIAHRRFQTVLGELVDELPLLKAGATSTSAWPEGPVARRMMAAVLPYAERHFITPMAAVAGAVADEILSAMLDGFSPADRPQRIYVNNGGDIALHLDSRAQFRIGMARESGAALGDLVVTSADPVRGIATSGRGGRSLSMGIADSVTILAKSAAEADAAASLVANAVDLPAHPAIRRAPANAVVDDSDLGDRLVVTAVEDLADLEIDTALAKGTITAETFQRLGLIHSAALFLKHEARIVPAAALPIASSPVTSSMTRIPESLRHA